MSGRRKVSELEQKLQQLVNSLSNFIIAHNYRRAGYIYTLQEQSSREEISVLQEQLQSKEAVLAELQKSLLQKDRELENMKIKAVSEPEQSSVWAIICLLRIIICVKVAGYHAAHYICAKFPRPHCEVLLLEYRSSLLLAENKRYRSPVKFCEGFFRRFQHQFRIIYALTKKATKLL